MTLEPAHHGNTRIFPASLDPRAVDVVTRLTRAGYESYLVGGCVRDLLLGHIPKDFDVSTEARPRQIRRVFRNCRIIGRRFKLAHVHFNDTIIEVATFRRNPSDKLEADGDADSDDDGDNDDLLITRDNEFGNAEEDSVRRDFTINALLYDVAENAVIDYVGGFEDIEQRVLRTIGEPAIRLAEDPVRMLRAVKFTARLGLTVDPALDQAMHDCAELIDKSAPARVIEEIFKLLTCGKAEISLKLLLDYGLLGRLMPEVADHWQAHPERLVDYGRALDLVDGGKRQISNALLLAALFHDPWMAQVEAEEQADPLQVAGDLIGPAAQRTSIPRRDVARLKQLLVTQLRLARSRRGRRFRMNDFLAKPSTVEAIELLHMRARVGSADPEQHAEWAERLAHRLGEDAEGPHSPSSDEQRTDGDDEQPNRRKRRRGGRRRRRRREDGDREQPRADERASETPGDDEGGTTSGESDEQAESPARPARSRRRARTRADDGQRPSRGERDGDQPPAATDKAADDDGAPPTDASSEAAPARRRRSRSSREAAPDSSRAEPDTQADTQAAASGEADDAATPDQDASPPKRGLGGLVRRLFRKVLSPEESAPDPADLTTPTRPAARARTRPGARPLSSQDGPPVVGLDDLTARDDEPSASPPAQREASQDAAPPTPDTDHERDDADADDSTQDADAGGDRDQDGEQRPRKRRRRRRRRSGARSQDGDGNATADDGSDQTASHAEGDTSAASAEGSDSASSGRPSRSRRRGGRRGGGSKQADGSTKREDDDASDAGAGSGSTRQRSRGGSSSKRAAAKKGGQRSSSRSGRGAGSRKRSEESRSSEPAPKDDGVSPPRQAEDIEDLFDW